MHGGKCLFFQKAWICFFASAIGTVWRPLISSTIRSLIRANSAVTKAAVFISNFKKGNDSFDGITYSDNSIKASA